MKDYIKEKKSSLLKLKKTREKSKLKINPLKSNKRIKKKIIFKKNYKNKNSLRDDISLETNSTIITLDEEPKKYINWREFKKAKDYKEDQH